MKYENTCRASFVSRPNRFIAHVLIDGSPLVCHVKNTGRCKELLVPGAQVILQKSANPARKTAYDLIAVYKGERLINMDAAAPNAVCAEWLAAGGPGFQPDLIRPEYTHDDSRFDFYAEHNGRGVFIEVKGVTLEEDGIVRFPDAPTERGLKHLRGLTRCVRDGYEAWAVFVIQMRDVRYFEPNRATHPAFAQALREAYEAGVQIVALDCCVTEDSLQVHGPVMVRI